MKLAALLLFAVAHLVAPNVPGAADRSVTQDTVHSTICTKGWSSKARPPQKQSEAYKKKLYRSEHLHGGLKAFELDHLIPLEAGGASFDTANLWMEPIKAAKRADKIENRAHRDICADRTTLAAGQQRVIDWKRAHG